MLIAVQEDRDVPLAQSLSIAAARRGHLAKCVSSLHEMPRVLPADPEVIALGAARIDRVLLNRLVEIRSVYERALILLMVKGATASETMSALENGVAYVLPKPLAPSEVIAWLERLPQLQQSTPRKRSVADLDIELDEMRATKAGHDLMLTRSEFYLLLCLVEHVGRVTSIDRLLTLGSDLDEIAYSSLKTHISRLRQKLGRAGGIPIRISAKQLLGYILEPASDEESGAGSERSISDARSSGQARDASSVRLTPHSAYLQPDGVRTSRGVQSLTRA